MASSVKNTTEVLGKAGISGDREPPMGPVLHFIECNPLTHEGNPSVVSLNNSSYLVLATHATLLSRL